MTVDRLILPRNPWNGQVMNRWSLDSPDCHSTETETIMQIHRALTLRKFFVCHNLTAKCSSFPIVMDLHQSTFGISNINTIYFVRHFVGHFLKTPPLKFSSVFAERRTLKSRPGFVSHTDIYRNES